MISNTLPVIDINQIDNLLTLAELDTACREWGFFQVVNHGIPRDVIDEMLTRSREFFAQPVAQKREILRTQSNPWGFYDRELTKNRRDLKEIYDFGPPDGKTIRPQWPGRLPRFRDAVHDYYRQSERLAYRLLAAISTNLGMSPGFLSRDFDSGHTSFLRLNYYPVTATPAAPQDGDLGIGQHTDAGALTLLLQDDQPGLEVFRHNEWHLVEPRRDALVINIGDIVQVWSNDYYYAALHRVIASTTKPRYSIPFFLSPAYRMNYAPLPTMVADDRPARYRKINWGKFRALRAEGDYADHGEEIQIEHYRISA